MYPSNNLIYIPMTQSVIVANGLFSKTYKMYNVNIVWERESSLPIKSCSLVLLSVGSRLWRSHDYIFLFDLKAC